MLRHAIFVLVLVGAAFAGGAAINGPGLAWLQRNLIGGPTIIVDGSEAPAGAASRASTRFPTATSSPLPVPPPPPSPSKKQRGVLAAHSEGPPVGLPPEAPGNPAARLLQLPEPDGPDLAAAAARPAPANPPHPLGLPAASPDPAAPLDLPPDAGALAADAAKADPIARLASTTGGLDPAAAASPGSTRDWTEIRQRLKALGVRRYVIDAETDGRVRFSCVIPMPGLRAVGHHFEADGDDEFQAVEATIRRVTLWRATEPTRADP